MNPEAARMTFHVRPKEGIAPFTREWQAALVATGRILNDLGRNANATGLIGAWRSREGSTELHLEGRTTLLLDMRLERRTEDPDDVLAFAPRATREGPPGTGTVNLGIKMPVEWLHRPGAEHDDAGMARTMLGTAHAILRRIHLLEQDVLDDEDRLLDLGHAFALRDELGMTADSGPLRVVHGTPWSGACAHMTMQGEHVAVNVAAAGTRGIRLRGILINRDWPLAGAGPHPSMNLLVAPDETIADPTIVDPVIRLRAEAAWRIHLASKDRP